MDDLGNSMDFPLEPTTGQLHDTHVHYSGGVVVMPSVVDVPEVGPKPALVFRFATPEGGFYPPVRAGLRRRPAREAAPPDRRVHPDGPPRRDDQAGRGVKIYVSGPMTGLPDLNYPTFNRVAARLEEFGYDVLNPARHGEVNDAVWSDYMRLALIDLAAADGVCRLRGWQQSPGASLEIHIAESLGLPVRDLMGWQAAAPTRTLG